MKISRKLAETLPVNIQPIFRTRYPVRQTSIFAASSRALRLQPFLQQSRAFSKAIRLQEASIASPQDPNASSSPSEHKAPKVPSYDITFTCKACVHRSTHRLSKQAYHHGTVLITCPECKNRHIITDHLRVFNDTAKSLEQILMEKAAPGTKLSSLLKKGTLNFNGMTANGKEVPVAEKLLAEKPEGEIQTPEGEAIEFWEEGNEASYARHRANYKKNKIW